MGVQVYVQKLLFEQKGKFKNTEHIDFMSCESFYDVYFQMEC